MLKGLFKATWKSNSIEKRLRFIDEVDVKSASKQSILETLAAEDTDVQVRDAAIAKITNPQALYDLWQSSNVNKTAENALRNLLKSDALTESECKQFLLKNSSAKPFFLKYCQYADIRHDLVQNMNEMEQADIIADIAYSNTRVLLAENLDNIEVLEVARKNIKGKDKNAEKIIKSKIDDFHALQKLAHDNTALVTSIREEMESLTRYIHWSDEIRTKFFRLSKDWDALEFVPPENEKLLYAAAFSKVKADVKSNMAMTLSLQTQEQIVNRLETIGVSIAGYSLEKLLIDNSVIESEINDLKLQWNQESKVISSPENIKNRFNEANIALQSLISLIQSVSELRALSVDNGSGNNNGNDNGNDNDSPKMNFNVKSTEHSDTKRVSQGATAVLKASSAIIWPADFPELVSVHEAKAEANEHLNLNKQAHQAVKASLDKLHKRINRLFGVAKRGEIARANRELAAIIKSSQSYAGFDKVKLDERIEEAAESVRRMGDWKDFAIEPKLLELCEKMETLPELEKQSRTPNANHLAKKIKDLQTQWKAMGSSEISETYWPRFKQAADTAYEPCAEFFTKRREIQRDNLEKREAFIQQLKEIFETTDWAGKPDYKLLEERVSQTMQRWKKIKDVEHSLGQKQWEALVAVKDKIDEKLNIEYAKNIKAKQVLIEQMEQLLAEDGINEKNVEQTLDKLKFQQNKWKQVGVTKRKQDQTAWTKFKAASDAIYEKIQAVRKEKRAAEDEQIDAYKNIHKQIYQLAKTTQDLSVSDKELEVLESQYKELPPLPVGLPEKLIERLSADFLKACDAYAGAKERLHKAKLDNEFEILETKAQFCTELEQLPENTDAEVITELEDKINTLEINNKDYHHRFSKRLKKAREINREKYGRARRLLLIESEILLDVESPKGDKDLRLQIQLERMKQQGLGNASNNVSINLDNIKLDWLCLPGAEATLQKEFDERYKRLFRR